MKHWITLIKEEPDKIEEILNEPIWNNKNVKIDEKIIRVQEWQDKGILKIEDIINKKRKFTIQKNP